MRAESGFLGELKRRHVWRVAVAYAIVGWLVVQVATQVFPIFHMPDWTAQFVVILIVIGFPVAVVLAWAFEFTPEGIRRTEPAHSPEAREPHDTHALGRKLNAVIVAVLVIAVALLGWRLLVLRRAPATEAAATSATSVAAQASLTKSVAVLPFENLSNDKDNAYFAAGMQDLILTKLADIGSLKVISRTSTEKYKSRPENLKQVAAELGVATILEGSVQKAGNQVLINVQLINAKTDAHLWAQSYTRTLDNIFGVEGEVADKIADALNAKLSPAQATQLAAAPTTNPAAMDLFLRAEYQANKSETNYTAGDFSGWRAAIPLYRQAVGQDPRFALAYARLSYLESKLAYLSGEDVAPLNQRALADAQAAQKLAPNAAATWLALGYCDYYGKSDFTGALKAFAAALALRPNDSAALAARGYVARKQNNNDAALASLQQAFALDPRNSALAFEIGATYMQISRYPEAGSWFQRALAIDPDNLSAKVSYPGAILLGSGDVARALAAAQGDAPAMQLARLGALQYQRKFVQALALLDKIPDTPDNFSLVIGQSKALAQADLYRLLGDSAKARPLYQQALAVLRPQLAKSEQQQNKYLASVWVSVADAELGLGHTDEGLKAIAGAVAANSKPISPIVRARNTEWIAALYAQAGRADLAVPLLAQALTMPAIGWTYSPVMLWLDPLWDPIRHDARFQALLKKYARYKPAVIPAAMASATH